MTRSALAETTILSEAGAAPSGGLRYHARIIEGDRWGSSGYYSREVLERDGPTAWPQGTPVFFDHPGEHESYDRPERAVRDLAGKITSTPVYETDGLYATVEIYPHAAPVVEALAGDIGLSIRASASMESGERKGRRGQIVTQLHEGLSVDLVTKAGAGGKLVALMESARAGAVAAVREAIQESGSLSAAHNEPVNPAGVTESQEDTNMLQIEEAHKRQLEEAAGRVPALESAVDTATKRAEAAERKLAESSARDHARAKVVEANQTLDPTEVDLIVERATRTVPTKDDGSVDYTALDTATEAARIAIESVLAKRGPSLGHLGVPAADGSAGSGTVTRESSDAARRAAFGRATVKTGA